MSHTSDNEVDIATRISKRPTILSRVSLTMFSSIFATAQEMSARVRTLTLNWISMGGPVECSSV